MKAKLISFLIVLHAVSANAQILVNATFNSSLGVSEGWKGSKTNFSVDSLKQYNIGSSVQLLNSSNNHKRFTTRQQSVSNGKTYQLDVWCKGKGDLRFGIFDGRSTSFGYSYSLYKTINSVEFTKTTYTINAAKDTNAAEFIISVKATTNPHVIIDSAVISVLAPNGINEKVWNGILNEMSLFPNPVIDQLYFELPENVKNEKITISIVDFTGKVLFLDKLSTNYNKIDVSSLVSGIYQLVVYSESKNIFCEVFIKK